MKLVRHFVTLACVVLISSCGITPEPEPIEPTYANITDFRLTHGAPVHTFTFNAETGGTFTTPKGTVVKVPPDAFYFFTGSVTGDVTFEIKDIYDKSDMILSNVTTQSEDKPIVSGGMAWFRFTQDGEELYLNYNNPITVKMVRDPNAAQMDIYRGYTLGVTGGNVNWIPVDSVPTVVQTEPPIDSSWYWQYQLNNVIYSTGLQGTWINCDHPFATYTSTTLTLNAPAGFDDVVSYLVFDDQNTVVTIYGTYQFAPLGYDCTLVAYTIEKGKLYATVQPFTIGNNQTLSMNLKESTTEAFLDKLESLN